MQRIYALIELDLKVYFFKLRILFLKVMLRENSLKKLILLAGPAYWLFRLCYWLPEFGFIL